jgi:DNA invertase Pin-like site-specific DNA recombinase
MTSIISDQEYLRRKRARDKEYQRKRRRSAGRRTAGQYNDERKAAASQKRSTARELRKAGLSTAEIAATMEASQSSVRGWLR